MRTPSLSVLLTVAVVVAFSRWQGISWRICLLIAAVGFILGVVLKRKRERRRKVVENFKEIQSHRQPEGRSGWRERIDELRVGKGSATQLVMNDFELRRAFTGSAPYTQEEYKNFTHPQGYYGNPPTYEEYRELWESHKDAQPKTDSYEHYRYERF